ncbi:uncharacterized protein LOC118437679 [Folsomia candida]|uniref:uncharacterized protein LOC118437679 n=1 Tax=Folsomia candida TaxID=158441 RepID=UPI0016051D29|nr:uncharacterized protein LOC118437679 [Folsomia candida]
MGRNCAISSCPNRKGKPSHKVHAFPNAKHALLRTTWISRTIGTSSLKIDNFGVCSRHFSSNDYVAGQVTGIKAKGGAPVLKSIAIPTLNLWNSPTGETQLPDTDRMRIDMGAPICIELDRMEMGGTEIQQTVANVAINSDVTSNNELQLHIEIARLKSEIQECKTALESKNKTIRSLRVQIQRITTE